MNCFPVPLTNEDAGKISPHVYPLTCSATGCYTSITCTMLDICIIGHISLDKIVTPQSVAFRPGGTSVYMAKALRHSGLSYKLVTALSFQEHQFVDELRADGIKVDAMPSPHTVYFENIYSFDQDHREQRVEQKALPFRIANLPSIDAKIVHLGPLLSDDIPTKLIEKLAKKSLISLDAQGYLRYVKQKRVIYQDWADKKKVLPFVHTLKANEYEMNVLTGQQDPREGARYLADLGVQEVVITLGSKGSLIYKDGIFCPIMAAQPTAVIDATGCGDTYMAGYLWRRLQGSSIEEAGEFGSILAALKISSSGPFSGSPALISSLLKQEV